MSEALGHSLRGRVIEVNGSELKILHTPQIFRFVKSPSTQVSIVPIGVDNIDPKGLELIQK